MLFGTTLRAPWEFFVISSHPLAKVRSFVEGRRCLTEAFRLVPFRDVAPQKSFMLKDMHSCSHVSQRLGPYKILRRFGERAFMYYRNQRTGTLLLHRVVKASILRILQSFYGRLVEDFNVAKARSIRNSEEAAILRRV